MSRLDGIQYLSFGSGGIKTLAYQGAINALEAELGDGYESWRQSLKGIVGCSGGALTGIVVALGLCRAKRTELLAQFRGFQHLVRCPNIGLFYEKFGIEDGLWFKEKIECVLRCGGLSASSTLGDIKRLLRIDFVCVATRLNDGEPFYMSNHTTPHMLIVDAIYASCCIPLLFTPHHFAPDCTLIDGGVSCHTPNVFDEESTLFFATDTSQFPCVNNWPDYVASFSNAIAYNQKDRITQQSNVIIVRGYSASAFQTTMDDAALQELISFGFLSTLAWLRGSVVYAAMKDVVQHLVQAHFTSHHQTSEARFDEEM
jgi:predicted acylesterase/phospholipase RssA